MVRSRPFKTQDVHDLQAKLGVEQYDFSEIFKDVNIDNKKLVKEQRQLKADFTEAARRINAKRSSQPPG
ncbi:hypothetical protein WR25_11321 [Diploscapter pachys]|uniref:Uncharacterized protein n=1 Tax=Diploscapter pachys TaxID=2018661 RepID=A0A2A2JII1_9BILA|nr:hypothetical protein WR25_11321 [Diploscapter pachys]